MKGTLPFSGAFLLASVLTAGAQDKPPAPATQGEYVERTSGSNPDGNFVIPLPSSRPLSAQQLIGKKLFVQRCSVCHLPGLPTYEPSAPLLDGEHLSTKTPAALRQYISTGSPRMPGFRYALRVNEIDAIVSYLKGLELNRKGPS